ncbi:hypothetical protein OAD80_01665 [Porticoccaceae bacterium]|nr:hypothetical protein [Porticoccaceae bacterium]
MPFGWGMKVDQGGLHSSGKASGQKDLLHSARNGQLLQCSQRGKYGFSGV